MVHLARSDDGGAQSGVPDGLGITGLLNELLAAQEANSQRISSQHASGVTHDEGAEDEPEPEEEEVPGELALLHGEVDACLMSLGNWEVESQQRREELKRELEAKYGFSYDEALESVSTSGEGLSQRRHDELTHEDEGVPDSSDERFAVFAPRERPMFNMAAHLADSAPDAILTTAMQRVDDGRLETLRAEVDELRRRSAEADALHAADSEAAGTNDDLVGTASGLAAWCEELDQVLDAPELRDETRRELQVLEETEKALQSARSQAGHLEGALGDAYARMEAEIGDLEKLLADCDAARGKIRQAPAEMAPNIV
jgi:DNA repair exonuclease SbcCD ATPase subunit